MGPQLLGWVSSKLTVTVLQWLKWIVEEDTDWYFGPGSGSVSRASCSVKMGRRWLAKRGLGRASIGWTLEDGASSGSGDGGRIGGWMIEDVGGI